MKIMFTKIMQNIFKLLVIIFYIIVLLTIFSFLIESFSYSGFFVKHLKFDINILVYPNIIIAGLIVLTRFKFNLGDKWRSIIKQLLNINLYIFVVVLIISIISNLFDKFVYSNFIFSTIHIQPILFNKVLKLILFVLIVNFILNYDYKFPKIKKLNLSFLNKFEIKLPSVSIHKIKYFIVLIYTIVVSGLVIKNAFVFVDKFYTVDILYRQQNELKYFLQEMNIYEWTSEYLPNTFDVIRWCDNQASPVELVSFDPEIIWMTYEGLSRVFLTNCHYANIDPVSKSYDYFDREELLLVSVSKCDPQLVDDKPDPKTEIIKYFKIINNTYICKSKEIVPNLYLYKR